MTTTIQTRTQYLELFPSTATAMAHEESCLAMASEFRPPAADLVIAGAEPTPEYWTWLASQVEAEATETEGRTITAIASNPRPSTCLDIPGAIDLDVEVRFEDGALLQRGEVTLAPQQYDGALRAYGSAPDQWISGALLKALGSASELDFRAACDEIERAAIEAA